MFRPENFDLFSFPAVSRRPKGRLMECAVCSPLVAIIIIIIITIIPKYHNELNQKVQPMRLNCGKKVNWFVWLVDKCHKHAEK